MILIGSRALKHHYPFYNKRVFSSDYDLISSKETLNSLLSLSLNLSLNDITTTNNKTMFFKYGILYEIEIPLSDSDSDSLILNLDHTTWEQVELPLGITVKIAPVELLYAIISGSLFCPKFWSKHILDYHFLRLSLNVQEMGITSDMDKIMLLRRIETDKRYNIDSRINLNMNNDDFFKKSADKVHRIIEHDQIHELVKYNDVPLHIVLKNNKNSALISQKLFWQAEELTRLQLVREETMAIAIERYLLPNVDKGLSYKDSLIAYRKALSRICTNLTKGFFRQYANDHYSELNIPDRDLSEIVNNLLRSSSIDN